MQNPFKKPFCLWQPAQIVALLFLLLLLSVLFLTGLNLANVQRSEQLFLQNRQIKLDMELSLHTLHMREQVINVQQWLTDISVTQGLDGLDEGFVRARHSAELFRSGLVTLHTIMSKRQPQLDPTASIAALGQEFNTYLATGEEMAKAYIEQGTLLGNSIMKRFDAEAIAMEKHFADLDHTRHNQNSAALRPLPPEEQSRFRLARVWQLLLGREAYATYYQMQQYLWLAANGEERSQLAKLAQQLREDVLQTQQWLTDVSATRARDGLDDGWRQARERANHFLSSVELLRAMVVTTGNPAWLATVKQLESRFRDYYAVGLGMVDAYIEGGTAKGNNKMRQFDQLAEQLQADLQPFLGNVLERAGLQEFQVELTQQALADLVAFFRGGTVLLIFLIIVGGWRLLDSVNRL